MATFHTVTRSAAATSGGNSASAARAAIASALPSSSPTAGNHHAARPSADGPAASRPGTGAMVRKRSARISEPMRGPRRTRRSDGQDGIAARRELELLGLGVAQPLDQLVAQLRRRATMPSTSISEASL